MPLRLTCPHCRDGISLTEPFPLTGDAVRCVSCGKRLAVSYPPGVLERLRAKGKRFRDQDETVPPPGPEPRPAAPRPPPASAPPPAFPDDDGWFGARRPTGSATAGRAPTHGPDLDPELPPLAFEAPQAAPPLFDLGAPRAPSPPADPDANQPGTMRTIRPAPARPSRAPDPTATPARPAEASTEAPMVSAPRKAPAAPPPPPPEPRPSARSLLGEEAPAPAPGLPFDDSPFDFRAARPEPAPAAPEPAVVVAHAPSPPADPTEPAQPPADHVVEEPPVPPAPAPRGETMRPRAPIAAGPLPILPPVPAALSAAPPHAAAPRIAAAPEAPPVGPTPASTAPSAPPTVASPVIPPLIPPPTAPPPAAAPTSPAPAAAARAARERPTGRALSPARADGGPRNWGSIAARGVAGLAILGLVAIPVAYYGLQLWFGDELPSVEALRAYEPATVTTVHASDGTLLGEIYEERRYVLPLDQIPPLVVNAFIAAEDANFWNHGGIDYMGIVRAMGRNLAAGRVSQGGSTITQQVAKTFLLTSDRRIERKLKEAFLSWRTEDAYTKEHILYLYLNQIFLGSQAYGVEAAARTFFNKHVGELTLAEAAMIAGLPPRPSTWNPHADFEAAKNRQLYVLGQMVLNDMITEAEAEAARNEKIVVVARGNTFLEQAPHFTEYARRYLVDRYGEDRVLNEGLSVTTTCDMALQQVAQQAVSANVHDLDQSMGFRREAIKTLPDKAARDAHLDAQERALREAWALKVDPSGLTPTPDRSVLEVGEVYEGVVTEVDKTWFRARIGAHEGIIPIAWSQWVYVPDPDRSSRYRVQDDLTRPVDADGDGEKEGGIIRVGDVVQLKVKALSTLEPEVAKAFAKTPGAVEAAVALHLWQTPEVEAALLSLDIKTGAVRSMVGGADFTRSQFNRAVQSYRQVGSTFKPIVYAAALSTRKLTTASLIPDAPIAFANTLDDGVWKPGNYGDDYMGNITLRKALAMSRNTCTVRILDIVDPGMYTGVVSDFARALGIGGEPTHLLPEGWFPTPETDHLCPWIPETTAMRWCKDHFPPLDKEQSREDHMAALDAGAVHQCRVCDLSIALGSVSLTMEELARAYAAFPSGGEFVQPYYIEEVRDRKGEVLERHEPAPPHRVMSPELAAIGVWLLENVVQGGTGGPANVLGIHVAGKTGTTNEEKDAWFVGFSPDVLTAVWVGYDQPRSLGVAATGGRTALPIWIDYMREAVPKEKDRPFSLGANLSWIPIDEETGRRVNSGGRGYPFLPGTEPQVSGYDAGQASLEDLTTEF
jgi:penicillin-binding protein 1A